MKYKWRVQPEPTGRYRSFEKRGWPDAHYCDETESPCADIICEEEYVPRDVKSGDHPPLTLRIADHSQKPWKWVRARKQFNTLTEAKEGLKAILKAHQHLMPDSTLPEFLKRQSS